MTAGLVLRSTLFAIFQGCATTIFGSIAIAIFPLPPLTRYRIVTMCSRLVIRAAEVICGIRYRVIGAERIPHAPCIILAKHQSAWETLAFQVIFPPQASVVKRELLWIPFFGWGLAMLSPIAIDRDSGIRALKQVLKQGRERLRQGFWIVVFPEGTRVAPGKRGDYQIGGAWLAAKTDTPVLPVAHNAGELWRRRAFLKRPGLVTVSIGEPILPHGLTPQQIIGRAEDWIEAEVQRLGVCRT